MPAKKKSDVPALDLSSALGAEEEHEEEREGAEEAAPELALPADDRANTPSHLADLAAVERDPQQVAVDALVALGADPDTALQIVLALAEGREVAAAAVAELARPHWQSAESDICGICWPDGWAQVDPNLAGVCCEHAPEGGYTRAAAQG